MALVSLVRKIPVGKRTEKKEQDLHHRGLDHYNNRICRLLPHPTLA